MSTSTRVLAYSAALAISVVTPAAAQQPDSTARDSTRSTAGSARLAPVVVSGARLNSSASERMPVRVDVAEPTHALASDPAAAAELLLRLPGLSSFNDQGSRAQPNLDLRGFTLSPVVGVPQGVSVFLDGVRINEADAQELNFDLIPMDAVDRVELLRGPSAVFGKNTLGGVLNLYTARGGGTPVLDAELGTGAFGHRAARLTASGKRGGIDGYIMASGSTEDGYQAESGATARQIFATIGRRDSTSDVALSLLYAHDKIYEAGSLPESWLRVTRNANYTGGDFFRPDLVHVALRATQSIGGAQLSGNIFVRHNASEQFNANIDDPNSRGFITTTSLGGTAELNVPTRLGAWPITLTGGAEYSRNLVRYRLFQETTAAAPDLPDSCDPSGLCGDSRVDEDDAALYAQSLLAVTDRLSLLASARGDYVRTPYRDLRVAANSGTSTFHEISPKFGATYQLTSALSAYVSVGSGFRAPAPLELACASADAPCPLPFSLGADPPLAPVIAWNYEGGVSWAPWHGASFAVSAFRTEVRNEIVFEASERAAGFFQNIPRTRRAGLETSGRVQLPAGFRAFGSYSLVDATYQSSAQLASALDDAAPVSPGDRFPLSPLHRAMLGAGVTRVMHSLVLDGELSARAVSSQFLRGDEANMYAPLPAYAIADLRFRAEFQQLSLALAVTNLLDHRYETFGIFAENPVGPPGGPPPATPTVERFLTPGYPRAIEISIGVRR